MKKSIKLEVLLLIDFAIALSIGVSSVAEIIIFPNVNPLLLFSIAFVTFVLMIIIILIIRRLKKH